MMNNLYKTFDDNLYYVCRLDRYTPLTAKFIYYGAHVITPLNYNELIVVLSDQNKNPSREYISRGLTNIGPRPGYTSTDFTAYKDLDNNHSINWKNGYVHKIGYPMTFWDLDADLGLVLDDVFAIEPLSGETLIRDYLFPLFEDPATLVEALTGTPESALLQFCDSQKGNIPPMGSEATSDEIDTHFNALETHILNPLEQTHQYNDDIKSIILEESEKDERFKRKVLDQIVKNIFPKNDNADGYIRDGFKTLFPADAMKAAIYVGNIEDVLLKHISGAPLTTDDETDFAALVMKDKKYPSHMLCGMLSDYLSDTEFEALRFQRKTEYPQLGAINVMDAGYDYATEEHAVLNPANFETLCILQKHMQNMGTTPKPRFS